MQNKTGSERLQILLDDNGINVFDPNDRLGYKSLYITLLQEMALQRYLPKGNGSQWAVDVGCGYGRISRALKAEGWKVIGVDPSMKLLSYGQKQEVDINFLQAALPALPFVDGSIDLILLQNLVRVLLLLNKVEFLNQISKYLSAEGTLVVVDNIRLNHPKYFDEPALLEIFTRQGLRMTARYPLRAARWWVIYLIRYGLIPEKWLPQIAAYELEKRKHVKHFSHWQYMNVMYHFQLQKTV